jgi:hypothetical protein
VRLQSCHSAFQRSTCSILTLLYFVKQKTHNFLPATGEAGQDEQDLQDAKTEDQTNESINQAMSV